MMQSTNFFCVSMMSIKERISRHLSELRACLSWGNRDLKDDIMKAEGNVQSSNANIDYGTITRPFEVGYATNNDSIRIIANKCFTDIFDHSSNQSCPSRKCVRTMIGAIGEMNGVVHESLGLACCGTIKSAMVSYAGNMFLHGELLSRLMTTVIGLYETATSDSYEKKLRELIGSIIDIVFSRYHTEMPIPALDGYAEIAAFCAKRIVEDAKMIIEFGESYGRVNVRDVDVVVVVQALVKGITQRTYREETENRCVCTVIDILSRESAFFDSASFVGLIRTDIHVVLLELTLQMRNKLRKPTARLILLCWKRFASIYLQGLNDVLVHGLIPALTSQYHEAVHHALCLFSSLVNESQFLVDAFVNYDCDNSGFFQNIFEQTVTLVVKNSYPGQPSVELQKASLSALVNVVESLWKYYTQFDVVGAPKPEEAQSFVDAKKAKDAMDNALHVFKRSPRKGLTFFVEQGIVENTPEAFAEYMYRTPALDAAGIGEIIGGPRPLDVQILKCFVGLFDFKGKTFEMAFRQFLSKFQIPGEAQMIDRVMEQFGVKFYSDNPGLFSCADTVYVLAYSTLMLHTDAHHPRVTRRMTLEEFVANNARMDQGKDLPFEVLENLYHGITSKKIFTAPSAMPTSTLLSHQQQKDMYEQHCQETLSAARTRLTTDAETKQFRQVHAPTLVGLMFNMIWRGVMAALTMSFEETDEPEMIDLCIKGFEYCTHIASHCFIEDALDTMVDSFAKFTRLRIHTTDLKPKNVKCTSALVACAISDRNYLKGAWRIVLGEISALDKLRSTLEMKNDLAIAEALFETTASLDRDSILDFVQAMTDISEIELQEESPRFFMLMEFAVVASWNMERPMFIWKDIWTVIGGFLVRAGRSTNERVSATCIDIIRQLSSKFLSKEEIKEFHFQLHFLQPFIDIYDGQRSVSTKNLILWCIGRIIVELAPVLHSGWDAIFQIVTFTALDDPALKKKGFKMIDTVITDFMKCALPFQLHVMSVLASFVSTRDNPSLACAALVRYSVLADAIGDDEDNVWEGLLVMIGKGCQHPTTSVRVCAEEVLLSVLANHGCVKKRFSEGTWRFFLSTILRRLFIPPKHEDETAYYKHRITLFEVIHNDIFFAYETCFDDMFDSIFANMCFCQRSRNQDFAAVALRYTLKFLRLRTIDIPQHIEVIVDGMREAATAPHPMVTIVEIFQLLVSSCGDAAPKLEDLLKPLTTCSDTAVAHTAGQLYFKLVVGRGEFNACAQYLYEAVTNYGTRGRDWDVYIASLLNEVASADPALYKLCASRIAGNIAKLIECDSLTVREALVVFLTRE